MKRRTGFYSVILTSVVCMLGGSAFAASSVRMLGTGAKTVSAGTEDATTGASVDGGAKSGVATTAVAQTTRASSLRFTPNATNKTVTAQGYSGLATNGNAQSSNNNGVGITTSPSARLSIGKYLNLSHSSNAVTPGGATGGGTGTGTGTGATDEDLDALRTELDALQNQVDRLKDGKQNTLIVGDGEYIDIAGPDNNVISIDINALKNDLQAALDTKKPILTEIDDNYKLWWCYANATETACDGEKRSVVDLGKVLEEYDLANENVSLKDALAGKQGILGEADNGFITINQQAGTIGLKFDELRAALGIDNAKTSEIRYTDDGKLQWRYMDEFEQNGDKKWNTADIAALMRQSLENYVQIQALEDYVQKSELAGLQTALTADENGYLKIQDNQIGVKFDELRAALNIPTEREIEMEFDDDGKIQWRYAGADAWHKTNKKVSDFVDLSGYVLRSELAGLQGALTASENGYLEINNNQIGIKFDDLKTALDIPGAQRDIEMEITSAGQLRWRYLDAFEADGTTKKWTSVSENINDLIDGKLANYVSNESLTNTLNDYVTNNNLSTTLADYATKTYVDNGLAMRQVKLTEAANGFIEIKPVDGAETNTIGIKFDELKTALNIPDAKTSELRVNNGVLQWRYVDEFEDEPDAQTGESVKKWTDVYDLNAKLGDWVTNTDFNAAINRIDSELAGKQIKLTPADGGYIILDEQTGEIAVDMSSLRQQLSIDGNNARTSELRVFDGKLQWRYLDEFETDGQNNQVAVWHVLDLDTVELSLYTEKSYLWKNYYNKTYVDNLARTIENNINTTLERLALPDGPDAGLYMLSVKGSGDNKVSTWSPVQIVDADGNVQNFALDSSDSGD